MTVNCVRLGSSHSGDYEKTDQVGTHVISLQNSPHQSKMGIIAWHQQVTFNTFNTVYSSRSLTSHLIIQRVEDHPQPFKPLQPTPKCRLNSPSNSQTAATPHLHPHPPPFSSRHIHLQTSGANPDRPRLKHSTLQFFTNPFHSRPSSACASPSQQPGPLSMIKAAWSSSYQNPRTEPENGSKVALNSIRMKPT